MGGETEVGRGRGFTAKPQRSLRDAEDKRGNVKFWILNFE
jgi:hypothetical protein